jgi:GTP cyclohydrolase IB
MKHKLHDIDVANSNIAKHQLLDHVGMSNIECPVLIQVNGGHPQLAAGLADAYVNLDTPQRGIHMSRLFLSLTEALGKQPISPKLLDTIAHRFLESHAGISTSAHVKVNFPLLMQRPALISEHSGWRNYPVSLWTNITPAGAQHGFEVTVRYSSTCPCSAALARQLIQNRFAHEFSVDQEISRDNVLAWLGKEKSIAGVPHGQRSEGKARLVFTSPPNDLAIVLSTISDIETALATPVQSAVKREDEQEFARLNASNLMFAEDAIRRMSASVSSNSWFKGTACEVHHFESLHPHDAVAKVATGTLAGIAWH